MSRPDVRQRRLWPLIVAVIAEIPANLVVFFVVYEILKQNGLLPNPAARITVGLIAVTTLIIALVTWVVLYLGTSRGAGWKRALGHFAVLLLAPLVAYAGLAGFGFWVSKTNASKQNEANVRIALSEAANAEQLAAAHEEGSVGLHTSFPGDAGFITRMAKQLLHDVPRAYTSFDKRLHDLDYDHAMSPTRITAKDGFATTRQTLRLARAAMADRNRRIDLAMDNYRATIALIDIDAGLRKAALDHMDRLFADSRARRFKETDAFDALLDEQETTVDDLELAQGKWQVVGGSFAFSNDDAHSTYQAHIRKLISLSGEWGSIPH